LDVAHVARTKNQHQPPFDAVTLEILWRRTISGVDEAARLSAHVVSTLVNESTTSPAVLTDAAGQSLAQNTERSPPSSARCVTVKEFIKQVGLDNMRPGDVLVTNTRGSPRPPQRHHGGQAIFPQRPHRGVRRLHRARARHRRQGAASEPREVFEEGFHIPVMKLLVEGKPDATLIKLLRAAVRRPTRPRATCGADHRARPAGAPVGVS